MYYRKDNAVEFLDINKSALFEYCEIGPLSIFLFLYIFLNNLDYFLGAGLSKFLN